jgi:hypothetical protein
MSHPTPLLPTPQLTALFSLACKLYFKKTKHYFDGGAQGITLIPEYLKECTRIDKATKAGFDLFSKELDNHFKGDYFGPDGYQSLYSTCLDYYYSNNYIYTI